ncbi:hypothetical protein ACIA8C_20865 [Nocardia sp. NPDC051321]|uniref:hypothetical protein n=1 Tax=Nocardia sp. NPDC051321 TaxID=3364323 RepID=UPI0037968682
MVAVEMVVDMAMVMGIQSGRGGGRYETTPFLTVRVTGFSSNKCDAYAMCSRQHLFRRFGMLSAKRLTAGAAVATAAAAAVFAGGGVAQADVPVWQANCHVYNIFNTGGMSNCELPTWHQVKLTCVAWPVPFTYWKYGPIQYGQNQSWASCDSLNALVGIEVIQA